MCLPAFGVTSASTHPRYASKNPLFPSRFSLPCAPNDFINREFHGFDSLRSFIPIDILNQIERYLLLLDHGQIEEILLRVGKENDTNFRSYKSTAYEIAQRDLASSFQIIGRRIRCTFVVRKIASSSRLLLVEERYLTWMELFNSFVTMGDSA